MTTYTLSPSDLTFAWDGCKRCFYLKIKHKLSFQGTFPAMFGRMGSLTSNFYHGKACNEISSQLPVGMINLREKWVKSLPIRFPHTPNALTLTWMMRCCCTMPGLARL